MPNTLGLLYRTVKHLKPIQVRYRLWYIIRDKFLRSSVDLYSFSACKEGHSLDLITSIPSRKSVTNHKFTFLNQSHTFEDAINWNIKKYGKLWAYKLNYFDYLHQRGMSKEIGLQLIYEFINQISDNEEGLEPYPLSLRGINWIKFLSKHRIEDREIDFILYSQYQILLNNLEYHILGNHLLENGCSLLFGALYFQDRKLWEKAEEIIASELDEQILDDGGHYERSVMYHCVILERLLDCYYLLKNNSFFKQDRLESRIGQATKKMQGWLMWMQWENGGLPEVNDHVTELVPSVSGLFSYAAQLNLQPVQSVLSESGYRKYKEGDYEILVDVGNIGPDYVPGHAHSDIFSFLLRINGKDIITDTGTSTYENNSRRNKERSTLAHNTVMVNGKEQNEVWAAFRVGRRGHVEILEDFEKRIKARHDGYAFIDVIHERHFEFGKDTITICDSLKGKNANIRGAFYLHFYPGVQIQEVENEVKGEFFTISFSGYPKIQLDTYQKALGYKKLKDANRAVIFFENELITKINIHHF